MPIPTRDEVDALKAELRTRQASVAILEDLFTVSEEEMEKRKKAFDQFQTLPQEVAEMTAKVRNLNLTFEKGGKTMATIAEQKARRVQVSKDSMWKSIARLIHIAKPNGKHPDCGIEYINAPDENGVHCVFKVSITIEKLGSLKHFPEVK